MPSHKTSKNRKTNKTKKNVYKRPSPSESATSLPEGAVRRGGDRQYWVVKKASNGTPRWVPRTECELNGWRLLTVDILAKHIGKEVEIFERGYMDTWPSKNEPMQRLRFIPNGHAQVNHKKTLLQNWLKNRTPFVKKGQMFSLLGLSDMYDSKASIDKEFAMQVDSANGKTVSSNIMNMEAFIRV